MENPSLPPTDPAARPRQEAAEAILIPERIVTAGAATGAFSFIGILSILLAVIGLLGLCMSGSMVMGNANAAAPAPPAADASALERFQYEIGVESVGLMRAYLPAQVAFMVFHLLVAALLLAGGVRVLRRSAAGRRFMLYVLLGVIAFEVLRGGMYLLIMLDMMPIVDESLHRAMKEVGGGPQGASMEKILKRFATGITITGILFVLVWPAIKLLFYGWSARYLAGQEAKEICQG